MGLNAQQIRMLQIQLEQEGYGIEDGESEKEDEESNYTEGEINTRIKLMRHKTPSAPYFLFSYINTNDPMYEDDS